MSMWIDKKSSESSGKIRLAFREGPKGKPRRLPADQTPAFQSVEDAQDYCQRFNAKVDAVKIKIKRQLDLMSSYGDVTDYLGVYESDRKEKAPNSWQNDIFYLKHYVFRFFLEIKREGNPILWPEHFEEFRDWLKTVEPMKKKASNATLAFSTMNHCMKALNTFLEVLRRKKKLAIPQLKCALHPRSSLRLKGHEAVIPDADFASVFARVNDTDIDVAEGFFISRHSGVRENELFGLSLDDFFAGNPNDDIIRKKCAAYGLSPFGYLVLESQPKNSHKVRSQSGIIERKPLKHKKSIGPEHNRTIPILDKQAYNILVRRWNEQKSLYEQRVHGDDPKNYLLFDGLNKNRYYNALAKGYEAANVTYHSPHDTRHTFCTHMAGITGCDIFFCQLILGHKDMKTTERYWHIYEAIQRNLKSRDQLRQNMEFAGA